MKTLICGSCEPTQPVLVKYLKCNGVTRLHYFSWDKARTALNALAQGQYAKKHQCFRRSEASHFSVGPKNECIEKAISLSDNALLFVGHQCRHSRVIDYLNKAQLPYQIIRL